MHWDVMNLCKYLFGFQEVIKPEPILYLNDVEVVGVAGTARCQHREAGYVGKSSIVAGGELAAAGEAFVGPGELAEAEGAVEIGQAVVITQLLHFHVPAAVGLADEVGGVAGDAMGAQAQQVVVQLLVVGGYHAAFAGGDMLHGVEAENGQIGKTAVAAALLPALGINKKTARRVAGILNYPEAKLIGKLAGGFQVHSQAGEIDGNQTGEMAFGMGFEQGPNLYQINQSRGRVDVGKKDFAATVAHTVGRRGEGERRGDDALAGLHIEGQGAEVQSGRAIGHGHGIFCPNVGGKPGFKLCHARALGEVVGVQGGRDGGYIGLGDVLAAVGQGAGGVEGGHWEPKVLRFHAVPEVPFGSFLLKLW